MTGLRRVAIGLAGGLALAACARRPPPMPPPPTAVQTIEKVPGGVQVNQVLTVTAIVRRVNPRRRMLTLVGPDGQVTTIRVGPGVRNLDQVRRNDRVVVSYTESIALRLKKPGAPPEATVSDDVAIAALGQRPAGEVGEVLTATAKIVRIDRPGQTATLEGPQGRRFTVKVRDPALLDRVKVGDRVEVTYREALAVGVEPAPPQ